MQTKGKLEGELYSAIILSTLRHAKFETPKESSSPVPVIFSMEGRLWGQMRKVKGLRTTNCAVTVVPQLDGCGPAKQEVASSIPGWGTCLGCGFHPRLGCVPEATNQCFSLTSMFLSLSFSPFFPLSKNQPINQIFFFFKYKWVVTKQSQSVKYS